jgi:type VI secretion system VasD/TssJ family lipoprotein
MRNKFLFLFLFVLFFSSCSQKTPVYPEPDYSYQKNGIKIRYTSSEKLNFFNSKPHTLILAVYQLSNKSVFKEITKTNHGIQKILNIENFSESNSLKIEGAEKFDYFVISPGEEKIISMDRSENTRWIAVAAGFYNLDPDKVLKIYEIPVSKNEHGLFFKKFSSKAKNLFININLSKFRITKLETM